jgi:hypothetical protein
MRASLLRPAAFLRFREGAEGRGSEAFALEKLGRMATHAGSIGVRRRRRRPVARRHRGPRRGCLAVGRQDRETTKPLAAADRDHLVALANDPWAETAPSRPPPPTADYDELLIVADGDDTFYLEGFGPIRRAAAAKAIEALRGAAGL